MKTSTLFTLASLSLLAPALVAQTGSPRDQEPRMTDAVAKLPTSAREFRSLKVPGDQVEKNVKRLVSEQQWFKTLGGALSAGRAKGRPVLWIHALGDLEGFL